MLGWWIIISTLSPEERDWADRESRRTTTLANWETNAFGGLDWIDKLIEEGKATQLSANAYPNRYTAMARDVLPLLENGGIGPPRKGPLVIGGDEGEEYVQPPGWMGKVEKNPSLIAACSPDQRLTIDAWDLS
ncbi:hypothetical protein FACS1894158_17600 [Betaproteobacteria bacterium]|nr:hypothetical protein FACS1894158_17600 [Betaproteobacteria bacterium]GHU17424.1 hypothetical protein FACS189475_01210 [Betaproteobacteria bacterium]